MICSRDIGIWCLAKLGSVSHSRFDGGTQVRSIVKVLMFLAALMAVFSFGKAVSAEGPAAYNGLYLKSEQKHTAVRGEFLDWRSGSAEATATPEFSWLSASASYEGRYLSLRMWSPERAYEVGFYDASARNRNLSISTGMDHRGCSEIGGWFEILELELDADGQVVRLAVDFAEHCNFLDSAAWGSIRVNSSVDFSTVAVDQSSAESVVQVYATSPFGDVRIGGSTYSMSTPTARAGVFANLQGGVSARVMDSRDQTLEVHLDFGASGIGTGEWNEGLWTRGISVNRVCSQTSSSFTVHEVEVSPGGVITLLAVDFSEYCADGSSTHGAMRINSTRPIDTEFLDDLVFVPFLTRYSPACPEMSHSLYRLYTAYFLREPDKAGWDYWQDVYPADGVSLAVISDAFEDSEEFRLTYGGLSDEEFVDLVYRNVLGRDPDTTGRAHWVEVLGRGVSRGGVMLSFSESEEYVLATDTVAPLAGFLSWYDDRLQFSCGRGANGNVWLGDTVLDSPYADFYVLNDSDSNVRTRIGVSSSDFQQVFWSEWLNLPPNTYALDWNIALGEFKPTNVIIESESSSVRWTIAVYDHPHSVDRLPYATVAP